MRIELLFVSPLRGHGDERTYVDVLEGTRGAGDRTQDRPDVGPTNPDVQVDDRAIASKEEWLMRPGKLVLASAPSAFVLDRQSDGALHFVADANAPVEARPSVGFRRTESAPTALMVSGGGPGRRVAIWRVDPGDFLARHGYQLRPDLSLRLVSRDDRMSRIAPNVIGATDTPKPVTAVFRGKSDSVSYAVEVVDRQGTVLAVYEQRVPVRKQKLSRALVGAITGWHRSMLVSRVFDWAYAGGANRMTEATAFAVDMGVLVPGTAALAVPPRERGLLSAASRRTYDHDGVPLGAQRREADYKSPPKGALD